VGRGWRVSIPSRRVGDEVEVRLVRAAKAVSIPSRRVGDFGALCNRQLSLLFPSPQGGSETPLKFALLTGLIMFPSPQGGSETDAGGLRRLHRPIFHPLKAGRRPVAGDGIRFGHQLFHPLKAGRRLLCECGGHLYWFAFPSPQGGSETHTGHHSRR